jgi:hypothetical protein
MKHAHLLVLILLLVIFVLAACGPSHTRTETISPSTVKDIDGSALKQVILTEKAAERLGLETVSVNGLVVPYSAVIYDTEGRAWVYTNPEPLTFIRAQIAIDHIEGDQVFLAQELQTGAPIVTVGVAELYGAETGVSK